MLQLQARPPSKPVRHSPEAQPMADGQGEAAWGAEDEALVNYCEPLATPAEDPVISGEMRHLRLSHWVNNRAVFTVFMMSLGGSSIKTEKKAGNGDHCL